MQAPVRAGTEPRRAATRLYARDPVPSSRLMYGEAHWPIRSTARSTDVRRRSKPDQPPPKCRPHYSACITAGPSKTPALRA